MFYKLYTQNGKWSLKDNSMIFTNLIYLSNRNDALKYKLITDDDTIIPITPNNIDDYLTLELDDDEDTEYLNAL